jgi:8-oxo-dGTP pyrophosphatase MutT (NUDIX family)
MKTRSYAAAGGIVVHAGQILLLHKHAQDEYVLPKGHVEPGETLEQAALRETHEETGYASLRVLADLGTLRAEFEHARRWVVRDETYYLMALVDETRHPAPSHAGAAHDLETFHRLWVPPEEAAGRLSFEPAKTFARRAVAWLQANPLEAPP